MEDCVSVGLSIGVKLVSDIEKGRIAFQSHYKKTAKPFNEEIEHQRFIDYLESNLGWEILREMRWEDETYSFT